MTDFTFQPLVPLPDTAVFNAALGVNPAGKLTDKDIGKAVKLIGDSRYGLVAVDDDIEGVLLSVEPFTVQNGYGFGTVQSAERVVAVNKGAASIAVGAEVIAAAQPAVGTEIATLTTGTQTGVKPTPVKAGTGTRFKWRVVSLLGGNGAVDSTILIERI